MVVDTNLNTMVAEELRRIGAGEVNVRVASVQMSSTAPHMLTQAFLLILRLMVLLSTSGWMRPGFTNQRSTLILRQAKSYL